MAASMSVLSAPASAVHVEEIAQDQSLLKHYHAAIRGWLGSALGSRRRTLGIVVLGEAGVGKSSLVNGLLGKKVAEVGEDLDAATVAVEKHEFTVSGINVTVWDTPGFGIAGREEDVATMRRIKAQCKIDLVLYCVKMTVTRWPMDHDNFVIEKLTEVFDKKIWRYCQFVLTFANEVNNDLAFFMKKTNLFERKFVDVLTKNVSMAPGQKVNIVPTGDPRIRLDNTWKLPGIEHWFENFWFECCSNMRQSALPTLIRVNMHRMNDLPDDILSADEAEDTIIGDPQMPVANAIDEDSSIDLTIESHDQDVNFSADIGFDSISSIVSDQPSPPPPAARLYKKKRFKKSLARVRTQTKEPEQIQATRLPRPNSPNREDSSGLENHPLSFYSTMQHLLEKKDSGFSEYVETYARGRGEHFKGFGHSYGFFEGLVAYIHSKIKWWLYGTPEEKNDQDEEQDKEKDDK